MHGFVTMGMGGRGGRVVHLVTVGRTIEVGFGGGEGQQEVVGAGVGFATQMLE